MLVIKTKVLKIIQGIQDRTRNTSSIFVQWGVLEIVSNRLGSYYVPKDVVRT
jgi:hypothetical protein